MVAVYRGAIVRATPNLEWIGLLPRVRSERGDPPLLGQLDLTATGDHRAPSDADLGDLALAPLRGHA